MGFEFIEEDVSPNANIQPSLGEAPPQTGGGSGFTFLEETEPLTPQEQERALDIQEAAARPSVPELALQTFEGAAGEIKDLASIVGQFATSPIKTSKAIKDSIATAEAEDVKNFAKGLLVDFGRTVGFDMSRPGTGLDKFDIDVAIDRWTNQPLSAIGDVAIFGKAAGLAAKGAKAATGGTKKAMHDAIKRSGPEIKDMAEEVAKARSKAIERGSKIQTLSKGQEVAKRADIIKKIPLKSLNSPEFARKNSVELGKRILEAGRQENMKLNKALDPFIKKGVKAKTTKLREAISKQLVADNFADSIDDVINVAEAGAKEAGTSPVNIITPLNKSKLKQFQSILDKGEDIPVGQLKRMLDVIDDSIDWVTPRSSDAGLKIMRDQIRQTLGEISPEYDKLAKGISSRLRELGYVEKKLKRANQEGFLRNYREKIGLQIAASPERAEAFKKAMNEIGGEASAAALGRFDLIDAWKAWNDLYGTNQDLFKFAPGVRARAFDFGLTTASQLARKAAPGVDLPTAAGAAALGAARVPGAAVRAIPKAGVAATLTEGIVNPQQ